MIVSTMQFLPPHYMFITVLSLYLQRDCTTYMQNNQGSIQKQSTTLIIEVLSSGMLLQAWKITQSDVISLVILTEDSIKNVRRFTTCSARIIGNNNYFQDLAHFSKFMSDQRNFNCRLNGKDQNCSLALVELIWKVIGHNYEATHRVQFELQQQKLDERKKVQYQNKILKKQLEYYKQKSIKNKVQQPIIPEKKQISMIKIEQSRDDASEKDSHSQKLPPFRIQRRPNDEPAKTNKAILLKDRIEQIKRQINGNIIKPQSDELEKFSKNKKIQKQNKIKPKNNKANQKLKKLESKSQAYESESKAYSERSSEKYFRSQQQNIKTSLSQEKKRRYLHNNTFEIEYENGNMYRGELKDNKFHGKGTYFEKTCRFEGNWVNGETDGQGICYFKNGVVEKGIYRPGFRRFGYGQDLYENGEMYIGEFANQKKNGFGSYSFANGESYEGEWKDDLQHGKGIQYLNNDQRFQGIWVDDERHGPGVLMTKSGQVKQIWEKGKLIEQSLTIDK